MNIKNYKKQKLAKKKFTFTELLLIHKFHTKAINLISMCVHSKLQTKAAKLIKKQGILNISIQFCLLKDKKIFLIAKKLEISLESIELRWEYSKAKNSLPLIYFSTAHGLFFPINSTKLKKKLKSIHLQSFLENKQLLKIMKSKY